MKTSNEIREAFLNFFEKNGHQRVESAPLPQKDNPTLLFNNAGMNQFVNLFLGKEERPYKRATTAQKVMRVSGKHNDLENVGPSPRHHTFFEMLGNFSFGDYFKKDAIAFAWNFLTEELGLDKERLWVSIYTDDDEANDLWLKHVPQERILRFGKEENFWEMGNVGPCGPCSEIHYYLGDLDKMTPDGVNVDDEYLEIWNLVFMQFEKDATGAISPLPNPSIDTGMGLERVTQVIQGKTNNYDTDLFAPGMDMVQELLRHTDEERAENLTGYRVIADHVRAATFLLADGVRPGNDGADYVLRMIIRRAAKFGRDIGFEDPFMANVSTAFIQHMGDAYPEIRMHADYIKNSLTEEEKGFNRTLDKALVELERRLNELKNRDETMIPGDIAFDLYQTHGLPLEITRDVAGELGYSVDEPGYDDAREAHAIASGKGQKKSYDGEDNVYTLLFKDLVKEGMLLPSGVLQLQYGEPRLESSIIAIIKDGERTDIAKEGDEVEIVTASTPFYIESGGQISDVGSISDAVTGGQAQIKEMTKPVEGLLIHKGTVVHGEIRLEDSAMLRVDNGRRADIRRNHTATHILHEELRRRLGKHVTQAGSLVAADRLRFDFAHNQPVTEQELQTIERDINQIIASNKPISIAKMDKDEAIEKGAMALFGEKYGDTVRTVAIGDSEKPYSFELCGGLHVEQTGDINRLVILSEGSVSSGVRRIEAITGRTAREHITGRLELLKQLSKTLNSPVTELSERIDSLLAENKTLQKEIESLKRASLSDRFESVLDQTRQVNGINLLTAIVDGTDANGLRELCDRYRDKVGSGVAVLGTVANDRPLLIAAVTNDLVSNGVHAGNIIREVAKVVGGGGGGRPNLAQAGGSDPSKLQATPSTLFRA